MEWQDRMNAALAWIEANLREEIDWNLVAREANCSTFHFLRMFEVILGLSPGEYLRRRRLSQAASELAAGRSKVIDVAIKYGYESPDAFAKAFRRLFGCTPSQARQPGRILASYPPVSCSIVLKGETAMNYRIEDRQAFSLTGVWFRAKNRQVENFVDVPAFWQRLGADGTTQKLCAKIQPGSRIGICGCVAEYDPVTDDFTYLGAIETPADRRGLPEGCKDIAVPAATWGIFEARGPIPTGIQTTWKRIWTEWFPASGWECAEGPQLEIYSPSDPSAADYYAEVWIPLRRPR